MKYSKEFKEEALKLSDEIGLKKAAQKYQMSDEELKQRNHELEREIAELRKANDIFKDALGFFAKDRKK